ncbi:MAG: ATP-binding protein, partial [Ktedonobacterales bacterium]
TDVTGAVEPPQVLEGRCPQYGEAITYWPLAEMLRSLCDFTALDAPEATRAKLLDGVRDILRAAHRSEDPEVLAAYLGHTIGIESAERRQALLPNDAQQLQDGLLRSWRIFFEALATERPLLVLVDDIHWADGVLLDLLEYVATRATGVPLLLLCAARPELLERRPGWGGGKRNYVTIGLEALSTVETDQLVRSLLPGDEMPEQLRRGITRKAEGNPFYVEEIIRMLVDRGILVSAGTRPASWRVAPEWEGSKEVEDPAIPDTVQGVLAARLDLLSPRERDVLQHASVIGRYFWPTILRGLHPHISESLDDLLCTLQDKDLITKSDRPEASVAPAGEPLYSFTHSLTREVTYATIPRTRRAREHERVAEWLEQLARGREAEFADLIAQHYREYYVQANLAVSPTSARRQLVRDKVVRYLTLAGDQAAARHAAGKAERYYTNALAMLEEDAFADDVPRRVSLLMKRGDAHWLQVRGDGAWTDYRDALRLWSAYSTLTVDPVNQPANQQEPGSASSAGTPQRVASSSDAPYAGDARLTVATLSAPVAADGVATALADAPVLRGAQIALPLDWRTLGLRLYRLLVQLPTRYPSLFQQPPSHEELLPYLQEGLRLAEELGQRDTLEGAALLTAKTFFWWSWGERRGQRELLDAVRSAREAVRIAESLDDPAAASEALDALGNIQTVTADLQGNLESQTRRLHWARRLDDVDDVNELVDLYAEVCVAHTLVGEYATAEQRGQHALELAEAADADPLRVRALRVLVNCTFEWDHWADATRLGKQLQSLSSQADRAHSEQERLALVALAVTHARMGEREAAERIEHLLTQVPERTPVQFIEVCKARLALARGATKEARQILLAALDVRSGRLAMPMLLAELAELGARGGDHDFYERFGPQALELGWRSGSRKALAQATRARGIMAIAERAWDDAECDLESALKRYQELGTPWEQGRTHYALASFYRHRSSAGDDTLAEQELAHALELFESQHAVRDIARARAALAGRDVRLP